METPLEESNLAFIGSDEDKKAREFAAKCEVHWEGAGSKQGIEIWRIENTRTDDDVPKFGINPWPERRYGQFHRGDSYIVLQTTKAEEALLWDIYFWIGSESSQDEYGVAAYKANELDDLLGSAPVQHREVEGMESQDFTDCFPHGIQYLEGGVASGFRDVDADEGSLELPTRLFRVHKKGRQVRSWQVPLTYKSLNEDDAFLLDADNGKKIFTWFGKGANPFEKNKVSEMAHNMKNNRSGHCVVFPDIGMDNEEFWEVLGGRGHIQAGPEDSNEVIPDHVLQMLSVSHEGGKLKIDDVAPSQENLDSNNVFIVDNGPKVYIWVGKASSSDESKLAMMMVENHLRSMGRAKTTSVMRVLEGQENRGSFNKVF